MLELTRNCVTGFISINQLWFYISLAVNFANLGARNQQFHSIKTSFRRTYESHQQNKVH